MQQMPGDFPELVWEAVKAEQKWTGGDPCVLSDAALAELYNDNVDVARSAIAQVNIIRGMWTECIV